MDLPWYSSTSAPDRLRRLTHLLSWAWCRLIVRATTGSLGTFWDRCSICDSSRCFKKVSPPSFKPNLCHSPAHSQFLTTAFCGSVFCIILGWSSVVGVRARNHPKMKQIDLSSHRVRIVRCHQCLAELASWKGLLRTVIALCHRARFDVTFLLHARSLPGSPGDPPPVERAQLS